VAGTSSTFSPAEAAEPAGMPAGPLLDVEDLQVTFTRRGRRDFAAVDHVTFSVRPGETVGLVGESGCGKSVTSLAIMGLLPRRGVRIGGSVRFEGRNLLTMDEAALRNVRGRDIAMIFQDPMSSLNPVIPVGRQVAEVLERHRDMGRREASGEAEALLRKVGIPDPSRRIKEYPHQLSGGMRQRALIAMALACEPRLLIADEPTTALDVTIQAQILELLRDLVTGSGTALVMITHDLGVVAGLCDTVNVMYAGRIVERAGRRELFAHPRHQYTGGLLASIPRLDQPRGEALTPIRGLASDTVPWSQGCAFLPRCAAATPGCRTPDLPLAPDPRRPEHLLRCVNPVPVEPAGGTGAAPR
jgi:peptide/nickel transport system ATP-binding protein